MPFQRCPALPVLTMVLTVAAGCRPSAPEPESAGRGGSAPLPLAQAPDRFVNVDGATLRYREIGAGAPVLLIHGYSDKLEMWAGPADSLARDFRVIVPDVRGFGRSSKFADPAQYGVRMVDDLVGLLDSLGIRKAHVMGYSMGGLLAANLALRAPDRVSTATFVSGAFWPDSASAARDVAPYLAAMERGEGLKPFLKWVIPSWSDSVFDAVLPGLEADNDPAALIATLESLPGLMLDSASVADARTPVLVFTAVKDEVSKLSRRMARYWPGAQLVEVPAGDHGDVFLAPELIVEFGKLARGGAG